jgi:hypothetical protein
MSEIEIKDMLKEIKNKLDAVSIKVDWLIDHSHEEKKISNTFNKVFGEKDDSKIIA